MKNCLLKCLLVSMSMIACDNYDGDLEIEQDKLELTANASAQIRITSGESLDVNWTTDNEFVATVTSTGLVTAHRVGAATIRANALECVVTVTPVHNLYREPSIVWGTSRADIVESFGSPDYQQNNIVIYTVANDNAPFCGYCFDEGDILISSFVLVIPQVLEELDSFITERYLFVDDPTLGIDYYINALTVPTAGLAASVFSGTGEEYSMVLYTVPALLGNQEAELPSLTQVLDMINRI